MTSSRVTGERQNDELVVSGLGAPGCRELATGGEGPLSALTRHPALPEAGGETVGKSSPVGEQDSESSRCGLPAGQRRDPCPQRLRYHPAPIRARPTTKVIVCFQPKPGTRPIPMMSASRATKTRSPPTTRAMVDLIPPAAMILLLSTRQGRPPRSLRGIQERHADPAFHGQTLFRLPVGAQGNFEQLACQWRFPHVCSICFTAAIGEVVRPRVGLTMGQGIHETEGSGLPPRWSVPRNGISGSHLVRLVFLGPERDCLGFSVCVTLFTEKSSRTLYKSRAGGFGQPFQDRVDSWIVGGRSPVLGQTHQAQPWTISRNPTVRCARGSTALPGVRKKELQSCGEQMIPDRSGRPAIRVQPTVGDAVGQPFSRKGPTNTNISQVAAQMSLRWRKSHVNIRPRSAFDDARSSPTGISRWFRLRGEPDLDDGVRRGFGACTAFGVEGRARAEQLGVVALPLAVSVRYWR